MTVATAQGIQFLNLAYFGRPADPASLSAWPSSELSLEAIVLQFTGTAEYSTNTVEPNSALNPGGGRTFNDTNLINTFYQRLFGRLATSAEVAGWADALARGAVNYDYLGITILQAGLNLPAGTEMREVLIAKFDSNQLYTGILFNNPVDAAAYSTAAAIQSGIAFSASNSTATPATSAQAQTAVNQMVAGSGAGGGQTFTLTTNIDTATASTFIGLVGNGATLNTGDNLTGSFNTINSLQLTGLGSGLAGAIATTTQVPTVTFRGVGANGGVNDGIDQLLMSGVTRFVSNQSISDAVIANGKIDTTYALTNAVSTGNGAGNNPDITVTYAVTELAGTTTTAKFAANNAGLTGAANANAFSTFTIGNAATGAAATAIEAVSLDTAGSNNVVLALNSDVVTITGTGSGTNLITINGQNVTSNINFGANTGANTYIVGTGLTTNDTITGGTGTDIVRATLAGVAGGLSFTGVETLRLDAGSAGTAVFTTATGLATIDNRSGNQTNVITGAGALTTVGFVGAGTAAAQNVGVLTLSTALAGAADTLAVNFSNGGTAATSYTATLNVSGAETLNITTTDATVGVTNTLTLLSSTGTTQTGTTSLSFTSAGGYTLANGTGATTATAGGSLTSLNASGVAGAFNSGTLAANSFASGATITLGAGAGGNTLTFGNEAATDTIAITGGAGADNVVVGTGIFTANLGGGADIFNGFAATQLNVQGGDGADTIVASQGADTIIGNAGANTYQFAIGLAAVTAVAQVDSITLANAFAAGDLIITTLNGVQATYTVTNADVAGADTAADIALIRASLITFLNGVFGTTITATAAAGAGVISVTADVAGTAFTLGTTEVAAAGTATQAAVTANTAGVAGVNSTSNTGALDLLTYVNANADVIDLTTSAGPGNDQVISLAAAAGATATAAGINAAGLVIANNTTGAPANLNAAFAQLENVAGISGVAGAAGVFNFGGQGYLFISDATVGLTNGDVAIQLTGINALTTGLTLGGNNITAIA